MFEFGLVLKYLLPRWRNLSASIIAIVSVVVISLVSCLIIVFLSVVGGIENSWLTSVTQVYGTLNITPTKDYFDSHYYKADFLAAKANYSPSTIKEKLKTPFPYDPQSDEEYLALANVDIVGELFSAIHETEKKFAITFQDYEVATALMRLNINHKYSQGRLSQVFNICSLFDSEIKLFEPKVADLNNLLLHTALADVEAILTNITDALFEQNNHLFQASFEKGYLLTGDKKIPFDKSITLKKALAKMHFAKAPALAPPWGHYVGKKIVLPENAALLPSTLQNAGAFMGDKGELCYIASSLEGGQEVSIPFTTAGFYDCGILPVGSMPIFMEQPVVNCINSSSHYSNSSGSNGVLIWADYKDAKMLKKALLASLKKHGIAKFWDLKTYAEYFFTRPLIQQFQSDHLIFSVVAFIMIVVASISIITFLILLVENKKREIALLISLGATRSSIVLIFALCGICIGIFSSFIGTVLATIVLHNLDAILYLFSYVLGYDIYCGIFGEHLPNQMSMHAVYFVWGLTATVSLLAGIFTACLANKVNPTVVLKRS